MPEQPYFLALDCGTSFMKAGLWDPCNPDAGLQMVAHEAMSYVQPTADAVEMSVADIIAATKRCLHAAVAALPNRQRPVQIGICAHVSSYLPQPINGPLDEEKHFPIWNDRRAAAVIADLPDPDWAVEHLGSALPWAPNWLLAKAVHFGAAQKDQVLLQVGDLIFRLLCDCNKSHPSSQVSLIDQRRASYAEGALELADLNDDQLPQLSQSDEYLSDAALAEFGFAAGSTCAPALADMYAAFMAPELSDGDGIWLANTSEVLGRYESQQRVTAPSQLVRCRLGSGWMHYGSTVAGGSNINWCLQLLQRETADLPQLIEDAAEIAPGCDGLVHLPFLQGERAPFWDSSMRGGFFNLQAHHSAAHILRAVIEGIAFAKRFLSEHFESALPERFFIAGGGSRFDLMNEIRASILNRPLYVCEETEFGLIGVLRHLSQSADIDESALSELMRYRVIDPNPSWVAAYDAAYAQFQALLPKEYQACLTH